MSGQSLTYLRIRSALKTFIVHAMDIEHGVLTPNGKEKLKVGWQRTSGTNLESDDDKRDDAILRAVEDVVKAVEKLNRVVSTTTKTERYDRHLAYWSTRFINAARELRSKGRFHAAEEGFMDSMNRMLRTMGIDNATELAREFYDAVLGLGVRLDVTGGPAETADDRVGQLITKTSARAVRANRKKYPTMRAWGFSEPMSGGLTPLGRAFAIPYLFQVFGFDGEETTKQIDFVKKVYLEEMLPRIQTWGSPGLGIPPLSRNTATDA
ncbi:MAG: hypothetical protein AAFZ38_07280 [Myxococcota bacterium]